MIWGNHAEMRAAVKRLKHFKDLFPHDAPFTSVTPFGRNLALFYDSVDDDLLGDFVLCAGAGRILNKRCDSVRVADDVTTQADIAAWYWRATEIVEWS